MEKEDTIQLDNHLGQTLGNADYDARLDEHAKELLADKTILSEMIKRLIPDFQNIPIEEIKSYINGTPYIGQIRVHPGETNPSFEEAVRSLGQESRIPNEGLATFDVLFTLTLPDSNEVCVEVYVDVEAQNSEDLPYRLETRAVYYLARLLSSQYQRDFGHSEYNRLRKVYSIWIVMEPDARNANTISSIAFRQTALLGNPEDNKAYDKAEAFIVRLQKFESGRSEDRLIGLLSTLFTVDLSPVEKKEVISRDFGIPVTEHIERMVANMCNYSSYVMNKGIQKGMQQGMQQGIQQGMQQGIQQGMQQGASQKALTNIKTLMETMNWNPLQAMDALKVPEEDRQKYAQLLKQ